MFWYYVDAIKIPISGVIYHQHKRVGEILTIFFLVLYYYMKRNKPFIDEWLPLNRFTSIDHLYCIRLTTLTTNCDLKSYELE